MFNRAIINLSGISSGISNKEQVLDNICFALRMLKIPFEIYHPKTNGFKALREDMNQDDTLYILNDSLQYHLCEKPNILISRSAPWVMSSPKSTTIGRLTQEMILVDITLLMSVISRNEQMRQEFDHKAATTHLITSDYNANSLEVMARHGMSLASWWAATQYDIHLSVALLEDEGELPKVNKMLQEGLDLLHHPDDLLIITNRDICLIKEATGIIRAYMDSMNIDCAYAHRVDIASTKLLNFDDIKGLSTAPGIDMFILRKSAKCIETLLATELLLARVGWDSFWAANIKNRIPYNLCYHYPHKSDWVTEKGQEGNDFNLSQISKHCDIDVATNQFGPYYKKNR